MKTVHPYLNFPGSTEEAFAFYKSVFGGELQIVRYRDMADTMGASEANLDKIANIVLPLSEQVVLMGTDSLESSGKPLTIGNNFYITLEPASAQEAETLFKALSDGGQVEMPLQATQWAELYGSLVDKFGVQWMVNYTGSKEFQP